MQEVDLSGAPSPLTMEWYAPADSFRRPILLLALQGLFDAGKAATNSLRWIRDHSESSLIGRFDPEEMYNFAESRPLTAFDADGRRVTNWPNVQVYGCRVEGRRDVLLVTGIEPQYRWRSFAEGIAEIVTRSRTELVITLGSTLAMTPHTRPARVVASSGNPSLAARMQLKAPSYEGPTGVVGVINQSLEAARIPVLSLRSEVPHYVPGSPSPRATQVLLRRLELLTRVRTHYTELDGHVQDWIRQVDEAVQADEESRVYLQHLEDRTDRDEERLPSGDDVAAELESFLRELGED